ncbi:MAG: thiol-disulfide oxidoreductase DCC family protein [Polyangiaceae bacterium]
MASAVVQAVPPMVPRVVVLFDGVCNLCNGSVNFLIDRDPHGALCFASLQSEEGGALLDSLGYRRSRGDPGTIVLVENGRVYERSTAVLRALRHLNGGWRLLALFLVVPRAFRDLIYRAVATRRYQWFGKAEVCRVPTPELRARFLAAARPAQRTLP